MSDKAQLIAQQNDLYRISCGLPLSRQARSIPGQLLMTAGIAALPGDVQGDLVMADLCTRSVFLYCHCGIQH